MKVHSESDELTKTLINQLYNLYDIDAKNCDFTKMIKCLLIGKLLSEIRNS